MGLFIGVAATVFGYSNLITVDVHWSILHIDKVPLWTVAVVPLALFVIAGTLYHWVDGLHHFTEHMRHRRRVHELEAEVASLRAHLDQVLEMPERSTSRPSNRISSAATLPAADERIVDDAPAEIEPVPVTAAPSEPEPPAISSVDGNGHGDEPNHKRSRSARRKRASLVMAGDGPRRTNKTDRSGSHVEGMLGDGKAEPVDSPEREP